MTREKVPAFWLIVFAFACIALGYSLGWIAREAEYHQHYENNRGVGK